MRRDTHVRVDSCSSPAYPRSAHADAGHCLDVEAGRTLHPATRSTSTTILSPTIYPASTVYI